MSSQGGPDTARLAREQEKAALARAAAELEAEREAMRAELAAIEEEERLEAERAQQAAKSPQLKMTDKPTSGKSTPSPTTNTTPAAGSPSKTPKTSKSSSRATEAAVATSSPSASEPSSDRKDKQKTVESPSSGSVEDSAARKERRRAEKEAKLAEASGDAAGGDSTTKTPKTEKKDKKDKKDKKPKTGAEAEEELVNTTPKERKNRPGIPSTGSSSSDTPSESKKPKEKKKSERVSGEESTIVVSGDTIKRSESGERLSKEKKPKKDRNVTVSGEEATAATTSTSSSSPRPTKKNPRSKSVDTTAMEVVVSTEELAQKNAGGPKPLTRVESTLKIPVLDLSNRRLTELPGDIANCTYLTKLYLARNMLTSVAALKALKDLQVLTVGNNSLRSFPVELSSETLKLKDLLLGDNSISTIPKGVQLNFPALCKLDLMGNKFVEFPSAILSLVTLTHLNLSWNQITEVPKGISALTQLTSLLLHHNAIRRVASGICQLSLLTTLELQENDLASVPESIAELSSLAYLNISHNKLKDWPSAFSADAHFDALIRLDLSHNSISGALPQDRFPEEPTLFPSLEELCLSNNFITSLPSNCWKNLTSVATLDLRNNLLTELSPEIEALYSLSSLEVGSNKLTSLPASLGSLSNLQILSFYDNRITAIPNISALEYLQYLNAGHNLISEISLEGLVTLEELFISGNPIKQLPENMADTCPNLKLLFASDLLLKKVPGGLHGLTLLEQLDFSFNRITEIPALLGDLESLQSLSFAHCKLETSKEREVLKTPGKGPWDCIEFWQNFSQILEVDLSFNKLKYIPKGLETKLGTECEVHLMGNPLVAEEAKNVPAPPQVGKRYQVGWSEMLGRRPTMEDQFLWQGSLDGVTQVDLFAVFDGHAAREAARFCAQNLPGILKEHLSAAIDGAKSPKMTTKSDTLFTRVFTLLNAALEKHLSTIRDTSVKHCGTTAVVVLIVGDTMQIANVGDSRAVLNTGERCTVDHKPRAEVDRIRSKPGGFVTGDGAGRINEVLAVSRSLGDFYMAPWVICEPHVFTKTLTKEDKYIILACDGIWDEIEDANAIAIVDPLVQEGDLFKACAKLRDMAYCAGSDDNISVMIIKLSSK